MNIILKRFLAKNALILLSILLIIAFGIYLTHNIDSFLDLTFYDESNYMIRGRRFWHIYIEPENGPLYSLWYWFLGYIKTDNIQLYYFNWQITTILPAILLFILLVSSRINTTISFCLAVFYMFADVNFVTWPRVSNFCICVITAGLIAANFKKSLVDKFLILAFTSLVSSFVRPEFFISYLLFVVLLFGVVIYEKFNLKKTEYIMGAIVLLLPVLIKVMYGLPMFEQDASRSVIAFGQYFTMNKFIALNIWPEDPWTNWEKHFYEAFGHVNSLTEALRSNPVAFFSQCCTNWNGLINKLYSNFLPEFLCPERFLHVRMVAGIFLLLSTILLFFSYYINKQKFTDFLNHLWNHKIQAISVFVFMIPVLISCIILFPREHYIYLMVIPLIYMGCIIYYVWLYKIKPVVEYMVFLLVVILLVTNIPSINTYFKGQPSLTNLKTAKFMRSLNVEKEVMLLENEGGINIFLTDNYHVIIGWAKNDTFNCFFERYNVNMIWVTGDLINDTRYNQDPEWNYFMANYQQWQFEKIYIPGTSGYLLIKV